MLVIRALVKTFVAAPIIDVARGGASADACLGAALPLQPPDLPPDHGLERLLLCSQKLSVDAQVGVDHLKSSGLGLQSPEKVLWSGL